MKKFLKVLFPVLTFLAMLFIFSNSLSTGEEASAKRGFVVKLISGIVSFFTGEELSFDGAQLVIFSKLFHVFEFCLFSFCLSMSVFLRRGGLDNSFQSVLLSGVLTALADEQLQMLSLNRGSRLSDVFVDLAGVLVGYGICFFLVKILEKGKKNGTDSVAS